MAVEQVDVVIIGAGLSGLRVLRELRDEVGLSVKVFEAGTDVGGTWFWNRYPGARTDTESWAYGLSFDKELLEDWTWEERFPGQPEVERYLESRRRPVRPAQGHRVRDPGDRGRLRGGRGDLADRHRRRARRSSPPTSSPLPDCSPTPTSRPSRGSTSFEGDWHQTSLWPQERRRLRGQAGGGDRDRRDGDPADPRGRPPGRPSDRLPAHPELRRPRPQPPDPPTRRWAS